MSSWPSFNGTAPPRSLAHRSLASGFESLSKKEEEVEGEEEDEARRSSRCACLASVLNPLVILE